MTEIRKFDELRVKTEGQLVQLIDNELERGIRDAHRAVESADGSGVAEESYLRAKSASAEASRLLTFVVEIPEDERTRVESRLKSLEGMLEALSAPGSTPFCGEDEIVAFTPAS